MSHLKVIDFSCDTPLSESYRIIVVGTCVAFNEFLILDFLTTIYRRSSNYDTVDLTINHSYEHDKNHTPRDYVI